MEFSSALTDFTAALIEILRKNLKLICTFISATDKINCQLLKFSIFGSCFNQQRPGKLRNQKPMLNHPNKFSFVIADDDSDDQNLIQEAIKSIDITIEYTSVF